MDTVHDARNPLRRADKVGYFGPSGFACRKQLQSLATSKTKQHIRAGPASSASSTVAVDPWFNGADPWGQYQGVSTEPPPSQHAQKKFDDVEQRLQESVVAQVTESVQQAAAQFTSNDRIAFVENQMQALMQSQSNLEAWMQDGQQKMQEFRQDQDKIQHVVGQCASTSKHKVPLLAKLCKMWLHVRLC